MSLENRRRAIELIDDCIERGLGNGNYILNQLLKAGFLSNLVTIYAHELKDELETAPFKCNTYSLDEGDGDAD